MSLKKLRHCLAYSLFLAWCLPASAKPTRFDMKDLAQRNLLLVSSDGMFEKTVALSHFLTGWIELDPENIGELRGEFEVDVRTLDTGLELKNIQLKEQLLASQEFPTATASISYPLGKLKLKLVDGKPITARVDLTLTIRNMPRVVPVNFRMTYFKENEQSRQRLPGNLLKINATAEVDLNSFGISVPSVVSALIAKNVQLSVDMVGSDRLPSDALAVPEGMKKK